MIYIISYPRSGNTAYRYLLEFLTGKPTNGICGDTNPNDKLQQPLLHKGTDFVAHKRHDFEGVKDDDTVIFITRDPLEAVIRHNQHRGVTTKKLYQWITNWFDLYKEFLDHKGNKMEIKYENLVLVASPESKEIYPNCQSDSPDYHKSKLPDAVREELNLYVAQCWLNIGKWSE